MKNYEALSRKHFDSQASEYDARETAYYSKFPRIRNGLGSRLESMYADVGIETIESMACFTCRKR